MSPSQVIRPARIQDAPAICKLINQYAERGLMLHRSLEETYRALRSFIVAEDGQGRAVGCAAVDIFWADLAEVRSLAVAADLKGKGVGASLLAEAVEQARQLGVRRLFTLTYEQDFFTRGGFKTIDRESLPEKVWSACLSCPKADACDEVAMMREL